MKTVKILRLPKERTIRLSSFGENYKKFVWKRKIGAFFGMAVPSLPLLILFLPHVLANGLNTTVLKPLLSILLAFTPALFVALTLQPDENELRKILERWEKYEILYNEMEMDNRKPVMTIKELGRRTGTEELTVRNDISWMISFGYVSQTWYDEENGTLYLPDISAEEYEKLVCKENRTDDEKRVNTEVYVTEEKEVESSRYMDIKDYTQRVAELNRRIRSKGMSQKLAALENTVSGIMAYVKDHPENNSRVRKLADYYLPTMLKLVISYAELEEQPVKTEKTEEIKKEIEGSMDVMNRAFKNMFAQMLEDTEIDISSDISVMKTKAMLDGLLPAEEEELLQQH